MPNTEGIGRIKESLPLPTRMEAKQCARSEAQSGEPYVGDAEVYEIGRLGRHGWRVAHARSVS